MNFGVIIEGNAIMQCLNPEIFPVFWEVITKSRSVICCRCSPNFKSNVVGFVKKMSGNLTLAIGDGGNDVNMIKAANIGVGIFGKEGHQAAFNSDYAISQFKYLERLLFVHGRYSLLRNSYFINFFFYKNLIFTVSQFWFALFSGFSGALLWDDLYYLGYNTFISSLPAAGKMLFDEDLDISFEKYKDRNLVKL
jgi:phospholipid-translocating ATPase